jgi:hypothetical protein
VERVEQGGLRGKPLNSIEIRALASRISLSSEENLDQNSEKLLSRHWFEGFMRRHPQFSPRKAQPLTKQRAAALNPEQVDRFFKELATKINENNLSADRIFNLDEKGFDGESMRPKTVIANKKQKHVNYVFDGFRQHFSVLAIVSADGFSLPPLFV